MSDIEKAQTVDATSPRDAFGHTNGASHQHTFTVPAGHTPFPTKIGNPGALGLFAFASTTFILSMYNVQARGVTIPNVVVGMALFSGGLAQLLGGMWEFARGNQFGGTAFTLYGAFWMSYATISIPSSGISAAFANAPAGEFEQAVGIYLISWFIFTVLLLIAALRRNWTFIALLSFLSITFLLLSVGSFNGNVKVTKAAGGTGIVTACIAYYAGLSELLIREESYVMLPLGRRPIRRD